MKKFCLNILTVISILSINHSAYSSLQNNNQNLQEAEMTDFSPKVLEEEDIKEKVSEEKALENEKNDFLKKLDNFATDNKQNINENSEFIKSLNLIFTHLLTNSEIDNDRVKEIFHYLKENLNPDILFKFYDIDEKSNKILYDKLKPINSELYRLFRKFIHFSTINDNNLKQFKERTNRLHNHDKD